MFLTINDVAPPYFFPSFLLLFSCRFALDRMVQHLKSEFLTMFVTVNGVAPFICSFLSSLIFL